jgi:MerR family transcriptional regulator, heat shock protein HspR
MSEDPDLPVYIISVAAELAGVHPQTLRIYERKGLLRPQRTSSNRRRYSEQDIEQLRAIQSLTEQGVNLAGVKRIMELQRELVALQRRMEELREQLEIRRPIAMPGHRVGLEIEPFERLARFPWGDGGR